MTTPDDVTPKNPPPAPKKTAAKKAAPAKTAATTPAKPKAAAEGEKTPVQAPAKNTATANAVTANPVTANPVTASTAAAPAKPAAKPVAKKAAPTAAKAEPTETAAKPTATKKAVPKTAAAPKTTAPKAEPKKPVATVAKVADTPAAAPTAMASPPIVSSPSPIVTSPPIVTAPPPVPPAKDPANLPASKILERAAKKPLKGDIKAIIQQKAAIYWRLTRMDRPIGTLLLLWPTLWSLWIAAKGVPSVKNLVIFVLGVIVMRAAGCVINDFADRKIDGKVERTKARPLATGEVSSREALGLFIALCLVAFTLVLFTDPLTIKLSVGGLILAFCYPFMKRHTHLPQVVLGAAFAWGIPMAYAAEAGELHQGMWLIYLAVVLWTVAYDTFYAMVDRDDDLKIGVKSTAILFGEQDRLMTGVLQVMTLYSLMLVGNRFELGTFYYLGLAAAAGLFAYQQWLIRFRARAACFKAFLNNNWVGAVIFAGIVADYALRQAAPTA